MDDGATRLHKFKPYVSDDSVNPDLLHDAIDLALAVTGVDKAKGFTRAWDG